ncbi:MAG: type I restriction-modification system subunit M [Prevotella sp.]|nr:type I restriction-modification system subunit M [Prevotella sp.]
MENRLWEAADQLRANSSIGAHDYTAPVLGLIFLRFATLKYNQFKEDITKTYLASKGKRNERSKEEIAVEKCGFYLPEEANYDSLLRMPKESDIVSAIRKAMQAIEQSRPELQGCLPDAEYEKLKQTDDNKNVHQDLAYELLKIIDSIPEDMTGDVFGKVYEYFLGKFASAEGSKGGEYYTPTSVVRLMVEMIEPYAGKILDPACGSGGMFVQSAKFIREHRKAGTNDEDLKVYGVEKEANTVKIARMNMFLNGLRSEIFNGSSYENDPFNSYGNFDFVMANPPFNVNDVNMETVKDQKRFNEFGLPHNKTKSSGKKAQKETVPNANYLWISLFATSLNEHGRAALVMANSACDAGKSEAEIRQKMIESGIISSMLSLPSNMFYNVTLPATLWFFDRARTNDSNILFIDARNVFRQIDRAHREFTEEQIHNLACIRHLYQGDRDYYDLLVERYKKEIDERITLKDEAQTILESCQQEVAKTEKVSAQQKKAMKTADANLKNAKESLEYMQDQYRWLMERFPDGKYVDVTGLCKAATIEEIRNQDYSLNPGRYVGVVVEDDSLTQEEFRQEMKQRNQELNELNEKANDLMKKINDEMKGLLG